ncbi:MAG: hypothetical protein EOP00_11085 [Pedobacter sp.]|nr:MAG: hypothetical protein EOP00_11085 [Pedobacter sp.]
MKKALKFWFGFLLILLAFSFFLNSCKAKKPLQNTTIENTDKTTNSDSKETVTINQEILDRILFNIGQIKSSDPKCDSLINYYRAELAKSIELSKQSGDNSYQLKYNEALKQMELLVKIGKTENKDLQKNTTTTTTYTLQKTHEIPVHFMEWWEIMFYRIGQIAAVLLAVYLIIKFKR